MTMVGTRQRLVIAVTLLGGVACAPGGSGPLERSTPEREGVSSEAIMGFLDAVAASVYEMRFHDEASRSRAWLERQRGKVDAGLAALEMRLGSRPWLCGGSATLADIAIACHLGFVTTRAPQFFDAVRFPGLARLASNLEARESFKGTAPPPA